MTQLRLIVAGIALAALVASHWLAYGLGVSDERDDWTERTARAAAEASEQARKIEQERFRATEILAQNHAAELSRARAAARAARGDLDRLRAVLAARDRATPDSGAAARPDGAAAERDVLGACAAELVDVAAEADRIAARLRGAQSYITEMRVAE